jgi:hypothetical protein
MAPHGFCAPAFVNTSVSEIGRTVDDRAEAIDAELGHLQEVLRG